MGGAARWGLSRARGGCVSGFQKTQTRIAARRPPGGAGGERGPQGQAGGDTEARGDGDPEARRGERRGEDSAALTGRGGQRAPLLLPLHAVGVHLWGRRPGRGARLRPTGPPCQVCREPSGHRRLPVPAARVAGGGRKRLSLPLAPLAPPRPPASLSCDPFACCPPVCPPGASEVGVTFWLLP